MLAFPSYAASMPAVPRPLLVDGALAVVLTGLSLAVLDRMAGGPPPAHAYLFAVLGAAPLALRQVAPVTTMSVVLVAAAGYGLQGYGAVLPNNGLGILLGMFTVATLRTGRTAAATALATALVIASVVLTDSTAVWPEVVQSVLAVLGAWAVGESTRRWSRRAEDLAARSAVAVAAERVRIARDLHDVVAHHMAVISLQAGVAEYVIDTDPATAKRAITTVGASSRDALAEMRRLLGVLRTDDADDPADRPVPDLGNGRGTAYRPQPGLASVDELVDRLRTVGLPVTVQVRGQVRELPAGADLTAYRVVQESLTNVVKHAGRATARVGLDFGPTTLTISVVDDGTGPPASAGPGTHGIRGMRERVELFGGTLLAQPSPRGGFAVHARLPIPEEPGTGGPLTVDTAPGGAALPDLSKVAW